MMILKKSKSEHGQYSAPQTFPSSVCPDGFLIFPETFLHVFYPEDKQYAGFVDITVEDDTVTSCTWNEEAYQAYITSLPEPDEPTPTPDDRITALEYENKTLKAQVTAQSEQMDFYEECIAEMASVVYA